MDLVGIGVLLIGVAFLVLSIFLGRVLNNFASILVGIDKTVEQLPHQLDGILNETGNLIHNTNNSLADVNEKLGTLTPIFHIIGDVGESTRTMSSALMDATRSMKNKDSSATVEQQEKRLGGAYGVAALGYYALRKGKDARGKLDSGKRSHLYTEGEQRAFDIERMKEEAKEAAREGKYIREDVTNSN